MMLCSIGDYAVTASPLLPNLELGIWQALPTAISPALIIFVACLQTPSMSNRHKCSKIQGKVFPLFGVVTLLLFQHSFTLHSGSFLLWYSSSGLSHLLLRCQLLYWQPCSSKEILPSLFFIFLTISPSMVTFLSPVKLYLSCTFKKGREKCRKTLVKI